MHDHGAAGNLTLILKSNVEWEKGRSMKAPFQTPPDLRGKWLLRFDDPGRPQSRPELHVYFAGARNHGKINVTVDGHDQESPVWHGCSGEYLVSSDLVVMKIEAGDELYYFNGNVSSINEVSGNFSCAGGTPPRRCHGTWTATRIK